MKKSRRTVSIALALVFLMSMFTMPAVAADAVESSPDSLTVRAYIDGLSVLCYQDGYIWWEHYNFNPPGTCYIDGVEWQPVFTHNGYNHMSETFFVGDKNPVFAGVDILEQRPEGMVGLNSQWGEDVVRIIFDDYSYGGAAWYEIRLNFVTQEYLQENIHITAMEPENGKGIYPGQKLNFQLTATDGIEFHEAYLVLTNNDYVQVWPYETSYWDSWDGEGNLTRYMEPAFDPWFLSIYDFTAGNSVEFELRAVTSRGVYTERMTVQPYLPTLYGATIAAGNGHFLALLEDNSLWAWGRNDFGQLGDGTYEDKTFPVKIMDDVIAVAAGDNHSLVLMSDGTALVWGSNSVGQLGDGRTENAPSPQFLSENVKKIDAHFNSSAVIDNYGDLFICGDVPGINWGIRSLTYRMSNVRDIALGYGFLLAIDTDDKLWGFGVNKRGQLGNANLRDTNRNETYYIMDNVLDVAAGKEHSLVITRDGYLYGFGDNSKGQITGYGGGTVAFSASAEDSEDPTLSANPVHMMYDVVQVSASAYGSVALTYSGRLLGLGESSSANFDELNNSDSGWMVLAESSVYAAADSKNILYIDREKNLKLLGPVGDEVFGNNRLPEKVGLTDVKSVEAGLWNNLIVTNGGALYATGPNWHGFYGNGQMTGEGQPGSAGKGPVKVMDGIVSASVGAYHAYAINEAGELFAWGDNREGQLGNGESGWGKEKTTPIKIMDGVARIDAGIYYALALKTDGSLWVWGQNDAGQLGDGTTQNNPIPQKLMDGVAYAAADRNQSFAVKTDGSLWGWGWNDFAQLGDGTYETRRTPVKLMDDVKYVYPGYYHTMGIKTDNSLWAWGSNWYGQIGDGTWQNLYAPKKIMDDVARAESGYSSSAAIKTDGSLWMWGGNYNGQIGDDTFDTRYSPVQILDEALDVSLGDIDNGHTLAIDGDGNLLSWGYNGWGELGRPTAKVRTVPLEWRVLIPGENETFDVSNPEDTTPPHVEWIYPGSGTYNGSLTVDAWITDDKWLSHAELETSVDGGQSWQTQDTFFFFWSNSGNVWFTINTRDFPDGELRVRVVAYDTAGNYSYYPPESILTIDNTPPPVPTGLAGLPALDRITLSWDASSAPDIAGYDLYRMDENGENLVIVYWGGTAPTFTDNNVREKVTYYYYVQAVDVLGNIGAKSETIAAQTLPEQTVPVVTAVSPSAGAWMTGTQTIKVTAQDDFRLAEVELQTSADGQTWSTYAVLEANRGTYQNLDFSLDSTKFADGTLHVRAIARDVWDNVSDGYPLRQYTVDNTPPAKVENLRFESTTTAITLNWGDVPDDDFGHFRVEYFKDGQFVLLTGVNNALGYVHGGLEPNTTVTYRVAAVDLAGNTGPWSDTLNAATIADTYPPVITAIRPAPARYSLSIPFSLTARDDHKVAKIAIETSRDGKNWTQLTLLDTFSATSSLVIDYAIDISAMSEGSLFVRPVAWDITGNMSKTDDSAPYTEYMIDRTPPAGPVMLAPEVTVGRVNIKWTQNAEPDLGGYTLFRADSAAGPFEQIASGLKTVNYIDSTVLEGMTYYYRLSAADTAGNVSGFSSVVSVTAPVDDMPPEILSISPGSGSILGGVASLSVLASDNYNLSKITAEYRLAGAENWSPLGEYAASGTSYKWTVSLNTAMIGENSIEVRARAYDASGNTGAYKTALYSLNITPPAAPVVTAEPAPMAVEIKWSSANESDLAGFRVYRKTPAQASYGLIATIPPASGANYSYTDKNVNVAQTYSYRVEAVDKFGNASSGDSAGYTAPFNTDAETPSAVMYAPIMAEVGSAVAFDGSASSDNIGVYTYTWDFGDGGSSSLARPSHTYTEKGTYTVKLTVADFAGNSDTVESVVSVYEKSDLSTATIKIMDEAGNPIPGASVYLNLGSDDPEIIKADNSGNVVLKRLPGTYVIGIYAEHYLPAKRTVIMEADKTQEVRFNLVYSEIIVGELTFHRMTLEEILAAGIDVYAPENQNVFKFEVTLTYGEQKVNIPIVTNGHGEIISGGEPFVLTGYGGGGSGSMVFTPAIIPTSNPEKPLVVIISLPGEASWLKDFFEVNLHLINKADAEFSLIDCVATLNVPDGLTLMENTTASGTASVNIGTIKGQESRSINWILRGDKDGSYELSADFSGILADFNEEISARFIGSNPLVVEAAQGLSLDIRVQDRIVGGQSGWIQLGLKNGAQREVYMPNLMLYTGTLTAKYKTLNGVLVNTSMDTLFPGETLWVEYMFPTGLNVPGLELYLYSAVLEAIGGNVTLPHTFSVIPSVPVISTITLPAHTLVEGDAANIAADITGGNLEDAQVILSILNSRGETVYTSTPAAVGQSSRVIFKLNAATTKQFPAGQYTAVVKTADGSSSASAALNITALPADIWTPRLISDPDEGRMLIRFAAPIGAAAKGLEVRVNGTLYASAIEGGNDITVAYVPEPGDVVVASGVKYPTLYPSYSFTFTVVCK